MQLTQSSFLLLSAVIAAQALSIPSDSNLTRRGGTENDSHICQKQGPHQCTLAVSALLSTNGLEGGTVSAMNEQLLDHDCNYITSDNEVQPKNPGFAGTIKGNGLSQPLYFGANYIGTEEIDGVSYQYNGQSYNQGNCDCSQEVSGTTSTTVCRCPFACPV